MRHVRRLERGRNWRARHHHRRDRRRRRQRVGELRRHRRHLARDPPRRDRHWLARGLAAAAAVRLAKRSRAPPTPPRDRGRAIRSSADPDYRDPRAVNRIGTPAAPAFPGTRRRPRRAVRSPPAPGAIPGAGARRPTANRPDAGGILVHARSLLPPGSPAPGLATSSTASSNSEGSIAWLPAGTTASSRSTAGSTDR